MNKQISEKEEEFEIVDTDNQHLENEMNTLEGEKNQLRSEIEDRKEEEKKRIEPLIANLKKENIELREDITRIEKNNDKELNGVKGSVKEIEN